MTITSSAINANGQILRQYTCEGENVSPPLTFSEVPKETKSLVLILEDPDALIGIFTHWLLYDLSPATLQLMENEAPRTGKIGKNDFGQLGYGGPCPSSGKHRYFFKLFALASVLNLPAGVPKQVLQEAMKGHIIDAAELLGTYTKTE